MAIYLQAAIYYRQMQPDGSIPCAYCWIGIDAETRSIDHVDNDPNNNEPDNLVAACRDCNTLLGRHTSRGRELLAYRLRSLGVDARASAKGVQRILSTPLFDRRSTGVVALAEIWFGDRLQYQREIAAARRNKGEERPRAIDYDEEVPF